jgi:hypothetical protein
MLLFRVLYYIVPFVLSVTVLTYREVILGARDKRVRGALTALDERAAQPPRILRDQGDGGI